MEMWHDMTKAFRLHSATIEQRFKTHSGCNVLLCHKKSLSPSLSLSVILSIRVCVRVHVFVCTFFKSVIIAFSVIVGRQCCVICARTHAFNYSVYQWPFEISRVIYTPYMYSFEYIVGIVEITLYSSTFCHAFGSTKL